MDRERPLMEHLQELRGRLFKIAITVGIITIFCVTFGIKTYDINGYAILLPYPDPLNSIAIQLMTVMKEDLLPSNVTLVQLAPGQAFFAQIYIAALLGVIFSMPVIVKQMTAFIFPGLKAREKGMIKKIILPAVGLFAAGCLFSYFVVIPYILVFLYQYGEAIGVATFLNITEFVSFVMQFLIAFGFSYQLPIIMWAVTFSGMVEPRFWRDNIRYAIIIIAAFGAVITPDGSGVTMWFIAGPMIALYLLAMVYVEKKVKPSSYSLSETERNKLRESARSLGIDYTSMSDEELRTQIEKREQEGRPKPSSYSLSETERNKLRESARSLGIDYTSMSDEELRTQIEKREQEGKSR
jgi:sec-independent protein translocase protein TatC